MSIGKRKMGRGAMMARGFLTVPVVFGLSLFVTPPATAQPVQITLLHINDTHSHLAAWGHKDTNLDGTLGGLPKAAWIVAAERATDPQALFVHAGDIMDGDVFFNEYLGVPELQLLKSIGLDAVHVGGHKLVADQLYSVTVTEGIYTALKYALGLKMQDVQKLPDLAFDAARYFVAGRGELGLAASNRIRDVAAIPGKKATEGEVKLMGGLR
jgi:hypothetical protein